MLPKRRVQRWSSNSHTCWASETHRSSGAHCTRWGAVREFSVASPVFSGVWEHAWTENQISAAYLDNAEVRWITLKINEAAPYCRAWRQATTPNSLPWQSQGESLLKVPIYEGVLQAQWKRKIEILWNKPTKCRIWLGMTRCQPERGHHRYD